MLTLEIGGGGFSSDGSEPSVEAVKGRLDCGAGYEFWLARQALARNPAIKLYGLQWSAPAWAATVTAACGAVRMWATSSTGSGAPAKTVAAVTNHAYRYGPAGLGSLGYYPVLYPSFTVRSHPRLDLALVKTMFASSDRRAGPE
jgi:hypothetical protein